MFVLLATLLAAPCNIHPTFQLVAVLKDRRVAKSDAHYLASANISFTVRQVRGATIVSVEPGLLEHVHGHELIARRVASSANGRIQANGESAAQARERLARAAQRMTSDQNAELAREEQTYETITRYGAAQSQGPAYGLPGGPDVRDPSCTQ